MGRAKERAKSIKAGQIDPGPDKEVSSFQRLKRNSMGVVKKVEFAVTYDESGQKGIVSQESDTDVVSMLHVWVAIMETVATKVSGDSKAVEFIKKVREDFRKEFSS